MLCRNAAVSYSRWKLPILLWLWRILFFFCLICLTIGRNLFILYILCADLCKSFEVPSCVCCCKVSLSSFIQHCEQGLTWSERYSVWIYYKMAGLAEIFLLSLKGTNAKMIITFSKAHWGLSACCCCFNYLSWKPSNLEFLKTCQAPAV